MKEIDELFSRGIASFIDPDNSLRNKIEAKKAGTYGGDITIKFGMDPTRPYIHIWHAVILRKLRVFQDLGCKVIFLVGDYTTQIGDPTGKNKTRPEISQAEIEANMKTYLDQVNKILKVDDPKLFSWIRNSDWFLDVTDVSGAPGATVSILRHITHARLIERDMFQDRINSGTELHMHEMLYPVMQGIDSAILAQIYGSCDLEIGGTDQTFNMLMGRDVMRMHKQPEQAVMSMDILEGLDGKEKMSKSLDNYVGINDEPADMYGKIMSIPDSVIGRYFLLATYAPTGEVKETEAGLKDGSMHPKEVKMRLARQIVAIYHGDVASAEAQESFTSTFSEGRIPEDVLEIEAGATLADTMLAAGVCESKSEARRLIEANAVTHLESDTKMKDPAAVPEKGTYRVGKIRFFKVV